MAAGRDTRANDATVEHREVTSHVGTCQGVLQSLPEGSGVWEFLHQSQVYLSQAAGVCV
jgi:hypothetical protein